MFEIIVIGLYVMIMCVVLLFLFLIALFESQSDDLTIGEFISLVLLWPRTLYRILAHGNNYSRLSYFARCQWRVKI